MEQPNIKKNLFLSTIYQILLLITPLITTPYISRVLGASGIGIYSYTYSIEIYFSMFAALGTVSYGAREIARNRNDRMQRSRLFWEIELLTILTTIICLIAWGIWILFNEKYRLYYELLTFYLLATMFDISWFYTGIEQFKYIVMQNILFKLVGIAAIFIFVRKKDDVAAYIAIMSLTMLLGNMSMWIYLPKFVGRVKIENLKILPHLKETFIYFIPAIATSMYTVLDKTLIGAITQNVNENGYYEQATKIINICKTVTFTALNSVLGARSAFLYAEKKIEEIKIKINQSIDYILFMGMGICFGLIGVSHRFVPFFFGFGYEKVIPLLILLSPLVIIIGISNCLGTQYYIPAGLRKQSARYIIIGSAVNLMLNLLLIPLFGSYGAAVSTLMAEIAITVMYMMPCGNILTTRDLIKIFWRKFLAALLMLGAIAISGRITEHLLATLALQVILGSMVYVLSLYMMKDSFVYGIAMQVIRGKLKR